MPDNLIEIPGEFPGVFGAEPAERAPRPADLKILFGRLGVAQLRLDVLEGDRPDPNRKSLAWRHLPSRETVENLQAFLNDPDPRVRGLQRSLEDHIADDLGRTLDAIEDQLDRITASTIGRRSRLGLRAVPGGRP